MTARCPRAATSSPIRRPTSPSMPRAPISSTTIRNRPSTTSSRTSRSIPTSRAASARASRRPSRERCASPASRRSPKRNSSRRASLSFNTIPPSDFGFFEMINENVQNEPATSYDVELAGQLAAIGIVHGKDFKPDDRMKKILSDAAAFGQATGRVAQLALRDEAPGLGVLRRVEVGQHALGGWCLLRDAAARLQGRHVQTVAADRRAHARFARGLLLRLHARLAGHDHAHSGRRLAVSDGLPRCGRKSLRRRQDVQGDAAQGHSGRGVLVLHPLRQPDPLDAADAAEISARRQPELPLARRRSR